MTLHPTLPSARPRARLAPALLAAGIALAVTVWLGLGVGSPPGLLLLVAAVAVAGAGLVIRAPWLLVVAAPPLMIQGLLWVVFPYEIAFLAFAFALLLKGLETRAAWMTRVEDVEAANLAFITWAIASGFWISDPAGYLLGVRKLVMGALAFWVAYRGARLVSRKIFEAGLVGAALALPVAAFLKRASLGLGEQRLWLNRAGATDLGWGTSNIISTLLLVLTPPLVLLAIRGRPRWLRIASWPTLVAGTFMQFIIASRAGTVLFVGGVLVQLWRGVSRRRKVLALMAATLALAGLLLSPVGALFLSRFTSPRELGSMVIRIWYMREAWTRTVDNLPWGIGLHQGWTYPDKLQNIDPHNYWLAISSELGLPGVVLWAVVLVVLWRRLCAVRRQPGWQGEGAALQIAFWLSQLHTLVEPTFQGPQYQFLYFWVMGGYLGYAAVARERGGSPPDSSR